MKRIVAFVVVIVAVAGVLWVAQGWTGWSTKHTDPKIAKFNSDCDSLIMGIQQYHEFTGVYPSGNNAQVTKALLGQTGEKKVLILAVRRSDLNDKGEIVDPWGTPLMFYFSHNEVLIRSAGPNRVWEDSATSTADDLYRSTGKEKNSP
jgi:hypothetical protein